MTQKTTQWIYGFGDGWAEGNASMKDLLGGKGANLAQMCSLKIPVPSGFTITTEACIYCLANDNEWPQGLRAQINDGLKRVEQIQSLQFGSADKPLLLSVRSGSRYSMPGMMDTILNLGLNDETVEALAKNSGDQRFAWDCYRRFIQMYANVVLSVDHAHFEDALELMKEEKDLTQDTELSADDLVALVGQYKEIVIAKTGAPFPMDVHKQLDQAITAVFHSWNSGRAKAYRKINNIPDDLGTAVNIQAMVFGNMGSDSATGVAFTRDPATGENAVCGEYLINAQGEDVVAGIRTPHYMTKAARLKARVESQSMEEALPDIYKKLVEHFEALEKYYKDMQDIEFTVERGKLWILQTRIGKRTAAAMIKIAVDMVAEGLIDERTALLRAQTSQLNQLIHPTIDPDAPKTIITSGLPASPGAATGCVQFDSEAAERVASTGRTVILVRAETSPEDIQGMHAASGILTARGGMTSHAAVVTRGMGRPCVVGAGSLLIDKKERLFRCGDYCIKEGDIITINGATGDVILGEVPMIEPHLGSDFEQLMKWADRVRRMQVRVNAETPGDCKVARNFGAEGIGLCRTEHMFFNPDRIMAVRKMILASDTSERREALKTLLPFQRQDFIGIFDSMKGLPCTIRLLDPPLHEFLPQRQSDIIELAQHLNITEKQLRQRLAALHEYNPMLGHRGCRLGITYPEIYEMQVQAILEAALEFNEGEAFPEIMIPLVTNRQELATIRKIIDSKAQDIFEAAGRKVAYQVGTMIELPRAALVADELAQDAKFFSFGTNDLTQTALGISRDDSARFLQAYIEQKIYDNDPFASLDTSGVGQLVAIAVEKGRAVNPNIKIGICGEHGGDPDSIAFFEKVGLDYISCSPWRLPIARLAAAQTRLLQE